MIALETKDVGIKKQEQWLLQNLSLSIPEHSVVLLLGANGSGKTTLLRALAALSQLSCGEIFLYEKPLSQCSNPERAKTLSWLPAKCNIPVGFVVSEVVQWGRFPWHRGFPQKEDREKAERAMEQMGVLPFSQKPMERLSSGQQQKVFLAQMLASNCSLCLVDEPLAFLDFVACDKILKHFQMLAQKGEKTFVFSSHDWFFTLPYVTHVLLLDGGRVVYWGKREGFDPVEARTLLLHSLEGPFPPLQTSPP